MKIFEKNIINNKLSFVVIISIIFLLNYASCDNIEYNQTIGDKCSVNLQCNSGCCSSEKCVETEQCSSKNVYFAQAIICIGLVVIFTIYLIKKLKDIKEDFQEKLQKKDSKLKNKNKKMN